MAARLKRKRIVLNMQQKIDIINRLSKGESVSVLAREYNVGKSSIAGIKTSKDTILSYVSSMECKGGIHARKTMKSPYNKELDQTVYAWYKEKQTSGEIISGPIICEKALELNNALGGSPSFKASNGWLNNFKSRHGILSLENEKVFRSNDSMDESFPLQFDSNNSSEDWTLNCVENNLNQNREFPPSCDVIISVSEDIDDKVKESDHTIPSHSEALNAIDTLIEWAENQKECTSLDVLNLIKIRHLADEKAMSSAFSSNDSEVLSRKIDISACEKSDSSFSIDEVYEIQRCVDWIKSHEFSKVALQFPDSLLGDATAVSIKLEACTNKQMFVLGDTSFGSCCVDEIAAEHVSADSIIHFGHACLSLTKRLPVLYVFGKFFIDVQDTTDEFTQFFPDQATLVVLLYEVPYSYAVGNIAKNLKNYENLVVSEIEIPGEQSTSGIVETNENMIEIVKCQRRISIPKLHNINDYNMFYIGNRNETLTNFMLSLNYCKFYSYHPSKRRAQAETLYINKHLKRRYYYIEKAKDAKIIGILVGTLGVSNYLTIISHLRQLIKKAGKKSYTLVLGKLNSAKLANFAEIEIFVNVACTESSLIECREFYQPIITPYELEIALNNARKWTGDYVMDFSELLPGAANHVSPSCIKEDEGDVSLVTGKIRSVAMISIPDVKQENTAVVSKDGMEISTIHQHAAGEFLTQRSWQGLERCLGETPVCTVQQGRRGIASEYEDEKDNKE